MAHQILGWEPKISFEEGLKRTIEWFSKYLEVYYDSSSDINQL